MSDHIEGDLISAFLDGALSASEHARADAHLSACPACAEKLAGLRHFKLLVSSAPRKRMPADLALALERRLVAGTPAWKTFLRPGFWIPAAAMATAVLAVGMWVNLARTGDELPLEPLLAAHERYSAESLVPEANLVASNYSDQMSALYADASDTDVQ